MLLYYNIVQINYLVWLPFAIYLKCLWRFDVHKSLVDKLVHSDKESADD